MGVISRLLNERQYQIKEAHIITLKKYNEPSLIDRYIKDILKDNLLREVRITDLYFLANKNISNNDKNKNEILDALMNLRVKSSIEKMDMGRVDDITIIFTIFSILGVIAIFI